MPENDPKWELFKMWAKDNGINLDHQEDWGAWWECWINGYFCGVEVTKF